ncbi:multidrug effflux MFS transporter [Rhodococcoides yunnanense]|uniref:multidrug effflux MFS transporter n=1 Tax=Rhodococcoides yunnanense TaxID=278209 RepID=UPI000A04FE5B|nr:multidrug effflux MFS transporter [Rhodococcus yunnanensis]
MSSDGPSRTTHPTLTSGNTTGRSTVALVLILGALTALGPLTVSLYLPALPTIGSELGVTVASVQLTLTGMLLGLALGQLIIGPYSDIRGRRRPIIVGTTIHIAASVLCVFATTVPLLTAFRVVQGFGAAAAGVVAMAVVRDLYVGRSAAVMLSRIILVIGVAPIIAPSVGGLLLTVMPWRGVFLVLACLGLVAVLIAVLAMPETLPVHSRRPAGIRAVFGSYRTLLADRSFALYVVVGGIVRIVQWGYIAGSAFVVQVQFGSSIAVFGAIFALGAVVITVASQVNVLLLGRWAPLQVTIGALTGAVVSGVVFVTMAATDTGGLWGFEIPLLFVLACVGLATPNVPALALTRHGESAGSASALLGFAQFAAAAVAAPLVGVLGADSVAVSTVMVSGSVLALGLLVAGARRLR